MCRFPFAHLAKRKTTRPESVIYRYAYLWINSLPYRGTRTLPKNRSPDFANVSLLEELFSADACVSLESFDSGADHSGVIALVQCAEILAR